MAYFGTWVGAGGGAAGMFAVGPNYGDGSPSFALSVGAVSIAGVTTAVLATKDTWIPQVAGCVDNTNKDGTNLQLEGIVATRKDPYMGWDLTAYPASAAVSSATLEVYVTAPSALGDGTITLNHLPNSGETWNEATLTCSTTPTLTSFQTSAGFGGTVGAEVISLNSTATARIATRLGVGAYSIAFTGGTLFQNTQMQSKDSGGSPGNAAGPRLSFSWSKTL